jgi:4-diphosphocytidyl-2-C-methyl-D-erythritol kinase
MSLTFYSPAKVNLFFKVISKREDGYHNIASLYQAISLADLLSFKKSKTDSFFCDCAELKWDDNNLIKKAVDLFRSKTKILEPLEIFLKKNIPMESGLGGGSSNAATTLWALNEIFLRPLKKEELIQISKKIGADVAFFFSTGRAYCTDIGAVFEDMPPIDTFKFYIAKPSFGMSTKKVYENLNVELLEKKDLYALKKSILSNNLTYFNDLEISAFSLDERLKKIKSELLHMGFEKVVMSGSGSSFICIGNMKLEKIKKIKFFSVFTVQRNLNNWYSF